MPLYHLLYTGNMKFGKLNFSSSLQQPDLLAVPTAEFIKIHDLGDKILVAAIDSSLADTAAFCQAYDIGLEVSANCVIVEAKRGDRSWYAACIILATTQRRHPQTARRPQGFLCTNGQRHQPK